MAKTENKNDSKKLNISSNSSKQTLSKSKKAPIQMEEAVYT